jgi:homoserine kinase
MPVTGRRRLVRVPASSANLGPGYDVMAAALSLTLELEVSETGEFSVEAPGLEVPAGRDNLVVRAFESLHPADELSFRVSSEIPPARGLGSSAAAIVAGLAAADHLYELALSPAEMLARAAELEGHPDNVAAAIHGGFVICGHDGSGPVAARFDPPEGLEAVAVIPAEEVTTEEARASIPDQIPIEDAVANVGAAALLVLGLQQADLNLVARGLRDRIHQPRRRDLYPRSMELLEAATELGALGGTISGAGPTLLVWSTWQDTGKVVEELERRCAGWAEVRRLPFTPHGVDVPEL